MTLIKTIDARFQSGNSVHITAEEWAELKAALKDAERYRWLRTRIESHDKPQLVIAQDGSWELKSWSGDNPDQAIDDAIRSQGECNE